MKTSDFNKYLDNVLLEQVKSVLKEYVPDNKIFEKVKNFQTLSCLIDHSTSDEIENGFVININNITDDILMDCVGGTTVEEAHKRLLQGLHHDIEDNGLGNNMDLDVSILDTEQGVTIKIKVTQNNEDVLGEDEENKNDGNTDKKDDLILGDTQSHEKSCQCDERNKNMKESKKKKLVRLTEQQLVKFIKTVITESEISQPYTEKVKGNVGEKLSAGADLKATAVPGANEAKKSRNDSGKENKEHLNNVEKKMKDYLSFDGNDNPEFPKQIGKGEKVARENSEEQEEIIDDNRGRGPQDLTYDNDFAEKQVERIKKAMTGDSTMGNEQDEDGNIVKSETGEKMVKNVKKRQEIKKDAPLYDKEAVPVDTKKKTINEEIEKMKNLYKYNQKTQ